MTTIPREAAGPADRPSSPAQSSDARAASHRHHPALYAAQDRKTIRLFGGVGPTPSSTVALSSPDGTRGVLETFGGLLLLLGLLFAASRVCCWPRRCWWRSSRSSFPKRRSPSAAPRTAARCRSSTCRVFLFLLGDGAGPASLDGRRRGPDPEEAPDPIARVSRGERRPPGALLTPSPIPPTPAAAPRPSVAERDLRVERRRRPAHGHPQPPSRLRYTQVFELLHGNREQVGQARAGGMIVRPVEQPQPDAPEHLPERGDRRAHSTKAPP